MYDDPVIGESIWRTTHLFRTYDNLYIVTLLRHSQSSNIQYVIAGFVLKLQKHVSSFEIAGYISSPHAQWFTRNLLRNLQTCIVLLCAIRFLCFLSREGVAKRSFDFWVGFQ